MLLNKKIYLVLNFITHIEPIFLHGIFGFNHVHKPLSSFKLSKT